MTVRKTLKIQKREFSSTELIVVNDNDTKIKDTKPVKFKLSLGGDKPSQEKKDGLHGVSFSFSRLRLGCDDKDYNLKKEERIIPKERKDKLDLDGKYVCMNPGCGHLDSKGAFSVNIFTCRNRHNRIDTPLCPHCGSEEIENAREIKFCEKCRTKPVYDGYNYEIEDTDLCGWCLMEEKKRKGDFQPYSKTG